MPLLSLTGLDVLQPDGTVVRCAWRVYPNSRFGRWVVVEPEVEARSSQNLNQTTPSSSHDNRVAAL